jgi:hypothetical protein
MEEIVIARRLLLGSAFTAVVLTTGASAHEPVTLTMMPQGQRAGTWVVGGDASFECIDLPAHGNSTIQFDFTGGGVQPQFLRTDAEGWSYTLGIARDFAGGWRLGLHGSLIDASGSASTRFQIVDGTPYAYGFLDGTLDDDGGYGGTGVADQILDVGLTGWALGVSAGQVICEEGDCTARADVSLSYRRLDTEYLNTQYDFVLDELHITNTWFETRSMELVGHLAGSMPLMGPLKLGGGVAAGLAFKDFEMDAFTNRFNSVFSAISRERDHAGFLARVEVNLIYDITGKVQAGIGGGFAYDSGVAVYVAPDYYANRAASMDTKAAWTPFVGARVATRF